MSRLILTKGHQKKFLADVKAKTELSFRALGEICHKNPKNLSDWYIEKSTIPYETALFLSKKFHIKIPDGGKVLPDFWHVNEAGKSGGKKTILQHGNPGTTRGRKLGGINSINSHKRLNTNFKRRQKIEIPQKSEALAEFFGIIIGDGGISKYQVTVTLSGLVDSEYSNWLTNFIEKLFKINASWKKDKKNVIRITISRTSLTDFLVDNGLPRGNKIKQQIDMPKWIIGQKKFSISCVRGLIDTDGCVYLDKHSYKNKGYQNICLDFTSASKKLLDSVYKILDDLKLEPKKYEKSIKIRKKKNVIKYFKIIGSHNAKHLNKFNSFIKGEVA